MLKEEDKKRLQERFQEEASDVYQPFSKELFKQYSVKRGLRNDDGTGVMAGLTSVGAVLGYYIDDGEKIPCEGRLRYRGINVYDIVKACQKDTKNENVKKTIAFLKQTCYITNSAFYCACLSTSNDED